MPNQNSFKCKKCGWCCERMIFPVYSKDHEYWLKLHGIETSIIFGRRLFELPIKCKMLGKDKKCKIYKKRPQMCKDFNCEMFKNENYKVL